MSNCSSEKVCGSYSLIDIDELSLKVTNEIYKLSVKFDSELRNAYSRDPLCRIRYANTLKRLNTYKDALRFIKAQAVIGSGSCFSDEEMQCLVEKIYGIIGKNCVAKIDNIKVDDSNEDVWALNNPYCRTFEEWDKWTKHVCSKLDIQLTTEVQSQNFVLEVAKNIISPNLLLAVSASREAARYDMELTRDDQEVEVEQLLLSEKVDNFDLSKKEYITAVKNGKLSYDMIKVIYEEGLSLEVEDGEVYLKTYIDRYNLNDISGEINPDYLKRLGREVTINKKDLLQDYK